MTPTAEQAETLRALHHRRGLLILPNAWDVLSARAFEAAGFPAVATSSAGLMASLGYPDGEELPRRDLLAAVERIARPLSVPLSADVVSGYGRTPREVVATVRGIVRSGAVGVNLEDLDPQRHRLFSLDAQLAKLRAIRALDRRTGIRLVLNARTDALRHSPGGPDRRLREAVRRAAAYRDAGADCVYPMGLTDRASIASFVRELDCPVNVMVRKGLPPVPELVRLGVKRLSFGPAASYATVGLLRRASAEIRNRGTYRALTEGAISYDELNALVKS